MRRGTGLLGVAALVIVAALGVAACGDDDDDDAAVTTATGITTTSAPASTTTTAPAEELPPVLFPANGQVLDDPLAAAEGFLDLYFPGTAATLGPYQGGDARSGEIEVLRPTEGGGPGNVAATLLVRQFGEGWYVFAAVNPNVTIDEPESGAVLSTGEPVTVSGRGRGFEATLVVRAVDRVGGETVAQAVAQGGAFAEPEPYSVDLDLSGCACDDRPLAVVVTGGTGLELDTGEFAAVPVHTQG